MTSCYLSVWIKQHAVLKNVRLEVNSVNLMSKNKRKTSKKLKTKIVRKGAYMGLSKATGFCTEPQKAILSFYFDSFSLPNAKRSKIKTFLKVSLVSLTFRLRTVFIFFEKMTAILLCWFAMKKWDLCKCLCAFNNFSNKNYCNLFCRLNSHLENSRATMI